MNSQHIQLVDQCLERIRDINSILETIPINRIEFQDSSDLDELVSRYVNQFRDRLEDIIDTLDDEEPLDMVQEQNLDLIWRNIRNTHREFLQFFYHHINGPGEGILRESRMTHKGFHLYHHYELYFNSNRIKLL